MSTHAISMFLCGDVMLGRGVDQLLPHPSDPVLRERFVKDARGYVELAERVNGVVARPVESSWPWGDALAVLDEAAPDARVINLETAVTRSDEFAPGKAVHYRMSPENLPCIEVARPDVCVLANNHVLDFGRAGLQETLDVLAAAHLRTAGAGRDLAEAWLPAVVPIASGGRALVIAFGTASSGIPAVWAASPHRPGIAFLAEPSQRAVSQVTQRLVAYRRPGDVVVASVHWGSNWGYDVSERQVRFAHLLIDAGVDVVHGHSSHHPRPIEVYRDRLVLYGCGDFINDYEGIAGHEEYRGDLRLMYLARLDRANGALTELRMIPMRARRMRLGHAPATDREWLRAVLDRTSRLFGVGVGHGHDDTLVLRRA